MRRTLAPALLAALACNTGFEPQYRVKDLRILAVRVEAAGSADVYGVTRADPDVDQVVQLEALVANPLGRAGLTVTWYACAPSTTGELPPCLDPAVLGDPSSLARPGSGAYLVGLGERPPPIALPQAVRDALAVAIQVARDLAAAEPTYQCRIYVEVPLVVVAQAEGRQEVALKRIRFVQPPYGGYVVNQNPLVDGAFRAPSDENFCTGGTSLAPPAAFPAGRTTLCGRWSTSSPPGPYNVCDGSGVRTQTTEMYSWQWYVTGGEFPDVGGVGNAEGVHLEFDRPAGAFTLWAILRDGRGGEGWMRFDVSP